MPDVTTQIQRARAAQAVWSTRPLAARLAVVRRVRQSLVRQAATLAALIPPNLQRACAETLVAEILPLLDACRFLERRAGSILAPQRLGTRGRPFWLQGLVTEIIREPLGVVLVLGPANYPLFLPGVQMLQAVVAGNAVLCKPGSGSSAAAAALATLLSEAGVDEHLVQVLPEEVTVVQAALSAGVDHVILTGATTTGTTVLAALAPHLVPATLELSGCDAVFVRHDADCDLAARALVFGMRFNGGATCIAPRRVFVAQACAQALEQRLVQLAGALPPCQLEAGLAKRVRCLVQEACQAGAQLCTGEWQSHTRCTPMIVTQATPAMRLLHEDLFAPVLSVVRVRDDEEALAAANRCAYGLGATVFGKETGARALAARVRAGVVVVNDIIVPTADPRLPFGGRGRSGFGVTRGAEGLLALTAVKAVAVRRGSWRPHFAPLHTAASGLIQAYIAAVYGTSVWGRTRAVLALVRALGTRRLWRASRRQEDKQ